MKVGPATLDAVDGGDGGGVGGGGVAVFLLEPIEHMLQANSKKN